MKRLSCNVILMMDESGIFADCLLNQEAERKQSITVKNPSICNQPSQLVLFAQSCLTLREPMDCSLPGFCVHGISQARILECIVIAFSRDLPDPGIESVSPGLAGGFFTTEPPEKPLLGLKSQLYSLLNAVTLTIFKKKLSLCLSFSSVNFH